MINNISRRLFIEEFVGTAGVVTASIALPSFINLAKYNAAIKNQKLNVALCGLGNYANTLQYGLAASQYCRLAGIVTGHPEKAAQWKKQHNIPDKNIYHYENFDSIVDNKEIDLVYIVLPNGLHKDFTIRAAKAGKHVICEKPMATSVDDAKAMITACRDANVQLAIGYRLHYEPTHLEIKRLGQEKVLGKVRMINAELGYKTYESVNESNTQFNINNPTEWRLRKSIAGGGPLMDLGIYCIQGCRYVIGEEPIAVSAQFGPVNNKTRFTEVEETITWQMEFPGGALANCVSSYGFNIDHLYAAADQGYFELSPALSYGPFKGRSSLGEINFPVINQQAAQLDAIGQLLLENKPLPSHITGEEGLKDIRIIEAIYQAAGSGKKISLI